MLGLLGASESVDSELVRVASTYGSHHRKAAPLDRETGPDRTWQWTLAVVVHVRRARGRL